MRAPKRPYILHISLSRDCANLTCHAPDFKVLTLFLSLNSKIKLLLGLWVLREVGWFIPRQHTRNSNPLACILCSPCPSNQQVLSLGWFPHTFQSPPLADYSLHAWQWDHRHLHMITCTRPSQRWFGPNYGPSKVNRSFVNNLVGLGFGSFAITLCL